MLGRDCVVPRMFGSAVLRGCFRSRVHRVLMPYRQLFDETRRRERLCVSKPCSGKQTMTSSRLMWMLFIISCADIRQQRAMSPNTKNQQLFCCIDKQDGTSLIVLALRVRQCAPGGVAFRRSGTLKSRMGCRDGDAGSNVPGVFSIELSSGVDARGCSDPCHRVMHTDGTSHRQQQVQIGREEHLPSCLLFLFFDAHSLINKNVLGFEVIDIDHGPKSFDLLIASDFQAWQSCRRVRRRRVLHLLSLGQLLRWRL